MISRWVEKTASVVLEDGHLKATLRACRTLAISIGLGYFVVVSSFPCATRASKRGSPRKFFKSPSLAMSAVSNHVVDGCDLELNFSPRLDVNRRGYCFPFLARLAGIVMSKATNRHNCNHFT